jgi:hypothetical protein
MHYVDILVERPEKNEELLDEYVKGYRRLDEAIKTDAAQHGSRQQEETRP